MRVLVFLTIIISIIFLISTFSISEARTVCPFMFKVDESMIDGKTWVYSHTGTTATIIKQGETLDLPLTVVKTCIDPVEIYFHATIGDQMNPKLPKGIEVTFEPNPLILEEGQEEDITITVKVDEKVHSTKYSIGVVGIWEKPNGFKGTSFSLNIGKDYGGKAIPVNFLEPPLKFYKYGAKAEEVPCRLDYVLVIKDSNGFPACVKPMTVEKLIERGWAKSE